MAPETEWAGLCEMQLKLLYGLVLAGGEQTLWQEWMFSCGQMDVSHPVKSLISA